MEANFATEFYRFLREELAISQAELAVVKQRQQHESDPLPMLLWQYGLITLEQLQRIFDWSDRAYQLSVISDPISVLSSVE